MRRIIQNGDDTAQSPYAVTDHRVVPRSAAGEPVILIQRAFPPPPLGSEGAITSEEGFESLGVIAVRLISEWSLPKCSMRAPERGGDRPDALPVSVPGEKPLRDW